MSNRNKEKRKASLHISGKLRSYLAWPVYIGIMLALTNGAMYGMDFHAGAVMSVFMAAYMVILLFMGFYYRPAIFQNLLDFAGEYARIQGGLLDDLSVPYALLDDAGNFLWMNQAFMDIAGKDKHYRKHISSVFSGVKEIHFSGEETRYNVEIKQEERSYKIEFKKISIEELSLTSDVVGIQDGEGLVAVYLYDITELKKYMQKMKDEGFVVSLIYIDNYEETFNSIDDVRRSLFAGLIDRKINKYFTNGAGIVQKLEKDRYLAVFRHKYLEQLKGDKFSILEEVKEINIGNEMLITVSLGIGTGGKDYAANYEIARTAIDLALGRGGDQAVIKEGEKVVYFGGKSQQVGRNTRIKARVKAHALRQILINKEKIFIMGHKVGDVDSFGSAIGIYRAAKKLGKSAHIVINEVTTSVQPFMDKFVDNAAYEKDMFLTSDQALDKADAGAVVVVTDVNRPAMTECPELLEVCKNIVVIDHHRQTNEPIKTAVLSYIESYASSASEMVAEILQYIDDDLKLKAIESDALYAGIIIDTDNYNNKCGVRTFESAAFLRRNGADTTRVRKMLRNDMRDYLARAEAISQMEVYRDCYAITVANCRDVKSPTVVGAQVANEMLDINGIRASFVVTSHNDKIYISARSIDEVNVQVIMEKLGGGGHMSVAGAQLTACTVLQAIQTVKVTLDKMISEGEI